MRFQQTSSLKLNHRHFVGLFYHIYCVAVARHCPHLKRKLSDYLPVKMLFIDFLGSLKETCVQRSSLYIMVIWRFPKGDRYIQV